MLTSRLEQWTLDGTRRCIKTYDALIEAPLFSRDGQSFVFVSYESSESTWPNV